MKMQVNHTEMEKLREMILSRTGLTFGRRNGDRQMLKLLGMARHENCNDMEAFYHLLLASSPDSDLWEALIATITVGETYFFRNSTHFDALRGEILPDLIARHREDRRLRIWSAGCATGEEPYSIAILLHELLPEIDKWNILILATDINKRFIRAAQKGHYTEWSFRTTDPAIRKRYFTPKGNHFELSSQIRKMVNLSYLNLVTDPFPSLLTNTTAMDLIICRNVSIYLRESQIRKYAEKFHRCLVPGGRLIVGAAETDANLYSRFANCHVEGAFIYQKTGVQAFPEIPTAPKPPAIASLQKRTPNTRKTPEQVVPPPGFAASSVPKPRTNNHHQKGRTLLKHRRLDGAPTCLEEHVKPAPGSDLAYYHQARLKADTGFLDEAQGCALKSIRLNPLRVESHYILGLIRQEKNQTEKAIAQFKKVLYLDPDFLLAHFSLAGMYERIRHKEEADRHRNRAIRLASRTPPDEEIPGSDGLTGPQLISMLKTMKRA